MRISDWSSDVCSSDLQAAIGCRLDASRFCLVDLAADGIAILRPARDKLAIEIQLVFIRIAAIEREIGRASCRERVCQYVSISVVAVSLKKKNSKNKKIRKSCRRGNKHYNTRGQ